MPDPIVRSAEPRDVPALGRLGAALVRLHHQWDALRFIAPTASVEQGYGRYLRGQMDEERSIVIVAALPESPDDVAGYCYGAMRGHDWEMLLASHGAIHDVYVDERARRRGVGRALVLAACAALEAKGAPRVLLNTATANREGRALFESVGFRATMTEMTRERGGG
jgi:ribosomal protein S18 acetylase RimI-like enzyme